MKIIAIFGILAACANAEHYILEVLHGDGGVITVDSNLRYVSNWPYDPHFKDCKSKTGIRIRKGDLGASVQCPDLEISMGLYFPTGYNGTISEAYDYHNKIFYPCSKFVDEYPLVSYVRPDILVMPAIP